MRLTPKFWTAQETELAERLVADNSSDKICIELLGRTRQACFDRVRRMRNKESGISNAVGHMVDINYVKVPPEVIEDRNRRLMERYAMDLTAQLMHDPEPSRRRV
jgi:predicted ATP-dependent Lon-type protease